jgi:hypothetical protein
MISRRRFSTAGLGLAAATFAGAHGTAPAASTGSSVGGGADLLAPGNVHRLYRRIRYGADRQAVWWWMRGRRFGLVDNVMTPFFGMEVGSLHVVRELGAERYEVTSLSAVYYSDLERGDLLTEWPNPVTGRNVTFRYATPKPSKRVYSYSEGPEVEDSATGMRADRRVALLPAEVIGGDVWLTEETYLRLTPEPPAAAAAPGPAAAPFSSRAMRVHDMYTFQCAVAALGRAPGEFVDAAAQFNDFNDWSPRFDMGDRPGTTVSRCAGRKARRLGDMPDRWRAFSQRLHGPVFEDAERRFVTGP